jgi:hypothetical protein
LDLDLSFQYAAAEDLVVLLPRKPLRGTKGAADAILDNSTATRIEFIVAIFSRRGVVYSLYDEKSIRTTGDSEMKVSTNIIKAQLQVEFYRGKYGQKQRIQTYDQHAFIIGQNNRSLAKAP